MRGLKRLLSEQHARGAASLMKAVCYLIMIFTALSLVLSLAGRQSFRLYTKSGIYENAILAEESHERQARSMYVNTSDDIYIWTNGEDEIDLSIRIGLSLMFALNAVPMLCAYYLLARVFDNVAKGRIFIEQNASFLFFYGLIQIFVAALVPFLKLLVCKLINLLAEGRIDISTGHELIGGLIPGVAFIVAAYIIRYGIHLQDEVDHTI